MGYRARRFVSPLFCLALLCLPAGCGSSTPAPAPGPAPFSVAAVKTEDWRSKIGETVEVDGYLLLNDDGTGVLVQGMNDFSKNTAVPESRYVALGPETVRGLSRDTYQRAKVRITGQVRETKDEDRMLRAELTGDLALCEVVLSDLPAIQVARDGPLEAFIHPCVANPAICKIFNPGEVEKHALLYSGGINKDSAHTRYWNDMVLYYVMLVWVFGYEPDNIIVVYKDGTPENDDMPVHYSATPGGLNAAFIELGGNMDINDDFFLFMTNHGSTTSDVNSPAPNDEDFGADTIDEIAFYYNSNQVAYDDDIAAYVDDLQFGRMCCVMEQCFSGGMIYDLRGPNRVICAACRETEVSWGGAQYDVFVMLFASALIGINQQTSQAIDADENGDDKVSVYEAFRWATLNDTADETPQYEDSGEGLSISMPSAGVTIDGTYGAGFFL